MKKWGNQLNSGDTVYYIKDDNICSSVVTNKKSPKTNPRRYLENGDYIYFEQVVYTTEDEIKQVFKYIINKKITKLKIEIAKIEEKIRQYEQICEE